VKDGRNAFQRIFAGLFYGQYVNDRQAFDERKKNWNLPHPIEMYLDVCSPETVVPDSEVASKQAIAVRAQAKKQPSRSLGHGQ